MLPYPATVVFNVAYHLLEQGYRNYTSHPLRIRLAHPKGHRVDILPARRSIRIRLERNTRMHEREHTALTVVDDICGSVDDAQRTRTMW
jgi:predicted metalloprotease